MLHSLSANRRKAWIGIGISDRYVPVLKSMGKVIKNNSYSELIIIIADKIEPIEITKAQAYPKYFITTEIT